MTLVAKFLITTIALAVISCGSERKNLRTTPTEETPNTGDASEQPYKNSYAKILEPDFPWHNMFGGQKWRIHQGFIEIEAKEKPMGNGPLVRACMEKYGSLFEKYAKLYKVKVAHFYATAFTESTCGAVDQGFDGLSTGLMQVIGSTCAALVRELDGTVISGSACKKRMSEDAEFSIRLGGAYFVQPQQLKNNRYGDVEYQLDPIKVAAGYNAGSLYKSTANPWRLRHHPGHLDRFAAAYNAFVVWAQNPATIEKTASSSVAISLDPKDTLTVQTLASLSEKSGKPGQLAYVKSKNESFIYLEGEWRPTHEAL